MEKTDECILENKEKFTEKILQEISEGQFDYIYFLYFSFSQSNSIVSNRIYININFERILNYHFQNLSFHSLRKKFQQNLDWWFMNEDQF